jgi:hypothetical protein
MAAVEAGFLSAYYRRFTCVVDFGAARKLGGRDKAAFKRLDELI